MQKLIYNWYYIHENIIVSALEKGHLQTKEHRDCVLELMEDYLNGTKYTCLNIFANRCDNH